MTGAAEGDQVFFRVTTLVAAELNVVDLKCIHATRDVVLNHRRGKLGKLKPNEEMDGMLLVWMNTEIPDEFRIGNVDASLMVIDVTGKIARCRISLVLDRSQRYAATQTRSRRKSLLADEKIRAHLEITDSRHDEQGPGILITGTPLLRSNRTRPQIATTSQEQMGSAERRRNSKEGERS